MKKIFLPILFILALYSNKANAQNVGIGETAQTDMKIQVKRADSAVLELQNSTTTAKTKKNRFSLHQQNTLRACSLDRHKKERKGMKREGKEQN